MFGRGEEKWTVPRLLEQLVLQARHYLFILVWCLAQPIVHAQICMAFALLL